jgi:hypothetical protein
VIGYAQPISKEGWELRDTPVIGVFVAPSFPDLEEVARVLREGKVRLPNAVWVIRDRDKPALEAMGRAGIEPVRAPSLPPRKVSYVKDEKIKEHRRDGGAWRDSEMMVLCTKILVFHEPSAETTKALLKKRYVDAAGNIPRWQHDGKDKINVIERGKKKTRARKGRKPVGA